jgi:hypothetical protein
MSPTCPPDYCKSWPAPRSPCAPSSYTDGDAMNATATLHPDPIIEGLARRRVGRARHSGLTRTGCPGRLLARLGLRAVEGRDDQPIRTPLATPTCLRTPSGTSLDKLIFRGAFDGGQARRGLTGPVIVQPVIWSAASTGVLAVAGGWVCRSRRRRRVVSAVVAAYRAVEVAMMVKLAGVSCLS